MTTDPSTPSDAQPQVANIMREFTLPLPRLLKRAPESVRVGGVLLLLSLVALWVRTRYIGGQFWMDEGITVGISSHSLSSIPGILRMDGSPPLFYMLLHIWMQMVGNGQAATHWLAEIFAALTIPIGYWGGHTIAGKRAALMCATLFAFNAFLDYYGVETRMYTLMALLGLLATIGFINGFVYRRRAYVILFSVAQALMFYTHAWAIYFAAGSFISLILLWTISGEEIRKGLIKDAVMAYVGAVVVFLPWLPNFIFQAIHTAAPWDTRPRFGAPVQIAKNVLGGASITVVLVLAAGVGYSPLLNKRARVTREAKVTLMLFTLFFVTLVLAWLGSQVTPAWVVRYFAPIVAPIVILLAIGMSRAGVIGAIAIVFTIAFMIRPSPFEPQYKSDMQDIGGEMGSLLHKGDLVIVGQPESMPLAYYYLPGGLRWSSTIGPVKDPTYMNWVNAMSRYQAATPSKVLPPLLKSLKPGQQVLFIRPLTEGVENWEAPWTSLIRRRSAQWGEIIQADVNSGLLQKEAWAPHNYRGSCCIADAAVLYKKV
jgi:mannosyltransferase